MSGCTRWCQALALVFAGASTLSNSARSGEVSERVGGIPELISQGYRFLAGGDLGPIESADVGFNLGKATFQVGHLYLGKENDLLVCTYTIVSYNPSRPSEDYNKPGSYCSRIK
jgi:hypothetical protein